MRGMYSSGFSPPGNPNTQTPTHRISLKECLPFLWPYLLEFKDRVILALCALVGAKVAALLMPLALKHLVDAVDISQHSALVMPTFFLIFYGILRFGSVFLGEIRDALFSRVTEHAIRKISLRVFNHLHSLELAFHLDRATGGISRDIERGSNGISFLMRFLMFNIVPTLFEILAVAIIFAAAFSIWYSVITIVAIIIYIVFTIYTTEWRNQYIRAANQADSSTNTRAVDSLINYETVKYFNNESHESNTYDRHLEAWESAKLKNRLSLLALNSGQAFIIAAALTLMMWMATQSVIDRAMTLGDLVMINAYIIQMFIPLNFLGFVYREIRKSLTDLENMLGLLKREPTIKDLPDAAPLINPTGQIEFKQVCFSYLSERPLFKDLSFSIDAGSRVAIVGPSGSGKSTLARLLYRFYDIQSGHILIDQQPINRLSIDSLRKAIAIVPQDTVLFNASIYDNIAYGLPNAKAEDIQKANHMANLTSFIDSLPKGDQTLVGERGLKVSGGEKQRIAIARALLKASPILIFDEATSALDSRTELAIVESMRFVAKNHTSIVIAHRLSTIVDADKIFVLNQGQIVEEGTHTQLIEHQGLYAQMWALQQQETEPLKESL